MALLAALELPEPSWSFLQGSCLGCLVPVSQLFPCALLLGFVLHCSLLKVKPGLPSGAGDKPNGDRSRALLAGVHSHVLVPAH